MIKKFNIALAFCFNIFVFSVSSALAQGEGNIWYFGDNSGLSFNTVPPTALDNGALNTNEGCASISDSDGEILFYTDGVTVYNKTHNIMLNGAGLLGDVSATQSAIICPYPENPNLYYIFTVTDLASSNGPTLLSGEYDIRRWERCCCKRSEKYSTKSRNFFYRKINCC
jgi:hypothetical protein